MMIPPIRAFLIPELANRILSYTNLSDVSNVGQLSRVFRDLVYFDAQVAVRHTRIALLRQCQCQDLVEVSSSKNHLKSTSSANNRTVMRLICEFLLAENIPLNYACALWKELLTIELHQFSGLADSYRGIVAFAIPFLSHLNKDLVSFPAIYPVTITRFTHKFPLFDLSHNKYRILHLVGFQPISSKAMTLLLQSVTKNNCSHIPLSAMCSIIELYVSCSLSNNSTFLECLMNATANHSASYNNPIPSEMKQRLPFNPNLALFHAVNGKYRAAFQSISRTARYFETSNGTLAYIPKAGSTAEVVPLFLLDFVSYAGNVGLVEFSNECQWKLVEYLLNDMGADPTQTLCKVLQESNSTLRNMVSIAVDRNPPKSIELLLNHPRFDVNDQEFKQALEGVKGKWDMKPIVDVILNHLLKTDASE
ncbi:UNVERIFIED_CONTAM: hypothetical protein HDU68_000704 [Siphonaria sp. JEL0065]|nr:hypothetical protein HDU68_000704 [Siphonaria sp. JEL0065]